MRTERVPALLVAACRNDHDLLARVSERPTNIHNGEKVWSNLRGSSAKYALGSSVM